MVYSFDFLDQEFAFIAAINQRRQRFQQTKRAVTPDLAHRITSLASTWPNLQAGAVQSLAQAGVPATHPVAVLAATRTAQADRRDGGGTRPGQRVHANWVLSALKRADDATRPGNLARLAGQAGSLAARGANAAWDASRIGRVVEPAVRTGFVGLEGLQHELVSRPITAAATADTDTIFESGGLAAEARNLAEAWRRQPTSPAAQALGKLASGQWRDIDVGSGFFADPESDLGKRYRQGVESTRLRSGQHATPGRGIVEDLGISRITEPGTRPYQLLTGLVDVGLNIYADPGGATLGAVAEARRAERTFGAALEQAGGIAGWARKTVDPATAAGDWLDTNRTAGRAVQWLADTDDFTSIWNALGRRQVPRETVRQLRDAPDQTQVREILRDNLTTHMRVKPTGTATSRAAGAAVGAAFDVQSRLARTGGRFDRPESARDIGEIFGVGAAVRHGLGGQRALGMLPKTVLDVEDLAGAQETLWRAVNTAKLPDDVARGMMDRFSRIAPDDPDRRAKAFEVAVDFHREVGGRLTSKGVANDLARRAGRMFDEFEEDLRVYYQEYGDNVLFEGSKSRTMVGPDGGPLVQARPSAQLLTEQARTVPLFDDLTEFRRTTGLAEQLAAVKGKSLWDPDSVHGTAIRMTANGWSNLMGRWGQAQLARLAWPVRVILEEQARMAAAGLDSAFRHPVAYLQWALAHDPETAIGRGVHNVAGRLGIEGSAAVDVMGDASNLAVQRHMAMNQAASREWAGIKGRTGVSGDYVTWAKADGRKGYSKAWAGELSQLWSDPVASRLAGGMREGDSIPGAANNFFRDGEWSQWSGNNIDDTVRWLTKGNGRQHLERLATDEGKRHLLTDPAALRRYLDGGVDPDTGEQLKGVWQRIQYQTGGDPELVAALGTGKLDGHDLRGLTYDRKAVYKALDDRIDKAPETVKAPIGLDDPKHRETLDRATDRFFEHLFSMPDNVLSRLPGYDQLYWRRITELTSVMSEDVARQALAGAAAAKIPRKLRGQLESRVSAGDGSITSLEVADLLAKDHALAETKKLLYDVSERSNFAEGTRLVTAFAEAWKEIATVWGRRLISDPQVARRGQQLIEGARESDPTDLLPGGDADPSTGDGFFYRDPTTDRERFAYPGLGVLAHQLIGLPGDPETQQQSGDAQGLNLFAASVLPGLGPVATMAVDKLLPDKPEWDDIRETLLPFGGGDPDTIGGAIETLLPAWARKMPGWFGDPRVRASTVGDVSEYLAANDESYYDANGMLDVGRLEADAQSYATRLMLFRGIAQFTLPTGPKAEFSISDESGELWRARVLGDELRKLQYGDPDSGQPALGQSAGLAEFVERFGTHALLATEGRSAEIRKRALSKPGAAWERSNPETAERWRDVIGFFAPESPDDFDIAAFGRQKKTGDRVELTEAQRIASFNTTAGHLILDNAVREIEEAGLDPAKGVGAAYMASRRKFLDDTYPGWNERVGVGGKLSTSARIGKIIDAVEDPTIAGTEAGRAAREYIAARDEANAAVSRFSSTAKSFADAKSTAILRAYLRQVGERLASEHPEFRPQWEQVWLAEGRMRPDKEYDAPEEEAATVGQ